jgi:pimeloyl-ACP methyl ester carboxylesterase
MNIRANGTDIHFVEAGRGVPLVLLHGGLMSTHATWAGHPGSYVSSMGHFAEHFRVIAPDTRGHGETPNPGGGAISYAQCADDIAALITALELDRPMICGFSDGGTIATLVAIRAPSSVRALVNDAGFDMLNPRSPSFAMSRQVFGGSPEATRASPEAMEQFFTAHGMADFLGRLRIDHGGAWQTVLAAAFDRFTTPSSATVEDLRKVAAPTLILTGDRDMCCSVEEAVQAFRMLSDGELAIVPGQGHQLSDAAIRVTIEFLRRRSVAH